MTNDGHWTYPVHEEDSILPTVRREVTYPPDEAKGIEEGCGSDESKESHARTPTQFRTLRIANYWYTNRLQPERRVL